MTHVAHCENGRILKKPLGKLLLLLSAAISDRLTQYSTTLWIQNTVASNADDNKMKTNWLIGKTIKQVDANPFPDGRGGTAHDPTIWFTDESHIKFAVEETEHGVYGIAILRGEEIRQ